MQGIAGWYKTKLIWIFLHIPTKVSYFYKLLMGSLVLVPAWRAQLVLLYSTYSMSTRRCLTRDDTDINHILSHTPYSDIKLVQHANHHCDHCIRCTLYELIVSSSVPFTKGRTYLKTAINYWIYWHFSVW